MAPGYRSRAAESLTRPWGGPMGKREQHASPPVTGAPQDARIAALEDEVADLRRQLERAFTVSAIFKGSGLPAPPPPAKRKRDRPPWLHVHPGGLAALAPVAFAAHAPGPVAAAVGARWLRGSPRARAGALVLALAAIGATMGGEVVTPAPREPAVCAQQCRAEAEQDTDAANPPLAWHPARSEAVSRR